LDHSMRVKRQQGGADQGDLFDEALLAALRHDANRKGGTGPAASEEPQARTAWDQERALTQHLMEAVSGSANLNRAYKRVKGNGGAPGVDGMTVKALRDWIATNRERLIASLLVHPAENPNPLWHLMPPGACPWSSGTASPSWR
jgi:RNA-directed DNA polymerase